jgi:hypothetical protein
MRTCSHFLYFSVFVLTAPIAGCALFTDWPEVHKQARQIESHCQDKTAATEKAAAIRCATPGIIALYEKHGYSTMALLRRERLQLERIAAREDRGELTEIQADAARADLKFELRSERERISTARKISYEEFMTRRAKSETREAEDGKWRSRR